MTDVTILPLRAHVYPEHLAIALAPFGYIVDHREEDEASLGVFFASQEIVSFACYTEIKPYGVATCVFSGEHPGPVLVRLVEDQLADTPETLLARLREHYAPGPGAPEEIRTLIRLALSVPPSLIPGLAELLDGFSRSDDETIRLSCMPAILMTNTQRENAGAFRSILDRLAAEDPSEMVRDEAARIAQELDLLDASRASGAPEDDTPDA